MNHIYQTNLPALIMLQFNIGLGLPVTVEEQSLTMAILMRWIYPLPTNSSIFVDPSDYVQKRSTQLSTRWDTYLRLETIIDRYEVRQVARLQEKYCDRKSKEEKYGLQLIRKRS